MDSGFPMPERVVYDGRYIHDWLKGEGAGPGDAEFTRTAATVKAASGKLEHGMVLAIETATSKWVPYQDGGAGGLGAAKGILLYDVDATTNDVDVAVITRRAVIDAENLKWHASVNTAPKKATALAMLAAFEIVTRHGV